MPHLCDWWMMPWSWSPWGRECKQQIFFFNTYSFRDFTGKPLNRVEFLKCCLLTTVYRVLHFLLMSSCLGQTKQMFGLESGFIWRGGRKYWEICYWHLIPDVSVDWKNDFFFISQVFSFFVACLNLCEMNWMHNTYLARELETQYSVSYNLDSLSHKSQSPDSSDHSEIFFFFAGV